MAKKSDKKLTWQDVDVTTIKGATSKAYDAYKAAQKEAAEKRKAFEDAFLADARKGKQVPEGKTLRFSYNFGRMGVALDDAEEEKAKAGPFKL